MRTGTPDPRLPPLPHGKDAVDVIADFLGCIWRYAKSQITEQIGTVADLGECRPRPWWSTRTRRRGAR